MSTADPGAAPAAPSDLAQACEWAVGHWNGFSVRSKAEGWDDDRLDAEMDRYGDILRRAVSEPARNLADLRAKALLCLLDFEQGLCPYIDPNGNSEPDDGDRLVLTILRELIVLTGGQSCQ